MALDSNVMSRHGVVAPPAVRGGRMAGVRVYWAVCDINARPRPVSTRPVE